MKKYILTILFISSLAINAYYIGIKIINKQRMDALHALFDVKVVPYADGLTNLFQKIEKEAPYVLNDHNYVFIQTWDTLTTTDWTLRYILQLDSIFATKDYAKIDKLLLSEMPKEDIRAYMDNHHIRFQSFTPISDAGDFISSVYTLKKAKGKSHPMQTILNKKGELLYYKIKLSGIEEKDSTLYHIHQIIAP